MASHLSKNNQAEIVAERDRLESVFRSYDHENILHLRKTSRLSSEGDITDLIDRLVRFDLHRTFGAGAAPWDIASDNDPTRGSVAPSLGHDESFDDVTSRTEASEVTHDEDPAFNSTVKENSEQAAHTTAVVSTITTVSSTVSTYSTGVTPRVYEAIYQGFASRVNQPRSLMSTGLSANQNETRDKTLDSQNLNSQYSYTPRAQSTMYQPWENSQFLYTQPNLPSSAEHYTHLIWVITQISKHARLSELIFSINSYHHLPKYLT